MMKIGIVTNYTYTNYGSVLQSYALQRKLSELGYYSENIRYTYGNKVKNPFKRFLSLQKRLILDYFHKGRIRPFHLFKKKYIRESKRIYANHQELEFTNDVYDIFVCGSDQIWGPHQFDEWYYLSFVNEEKQKIAYAPSIGLSDIPDYLKSKMSSLISRINALSVREKNGAILLKELGIKNIDIVLDPTLLLSKNEWSHISSPTHVITKYAFCYFLGENIEQIQLVRKYCDKHGLRMVTPISKSHNSLFDEILYRIGPQKFLSLVANAMVVFTDSLHGTIFSLIFHKKFFSFMRFKTGDKLSANCRIIDLLEFCGLDNYQKCEILDLSEIEKSWSINYDRVEKILQEQRQASLLFLKNSLKHQGRDVRVL